MSFFPDVNAGDPFIPNAGLSNAVRHIVNALNGFQSDAIPAKNMSIIRVSVYNASNAAFSAGQAISIDLEGEIIHDAYPAVAYDEDLPCYGVCVSGATAGGISDCVLTGIAKVIISGGTASSYAKPVSGGTFETSDEEGFRIINISGGTSAVILMGDYVKTGDSNYAPGIGITITGGSNGDPETINANITGSGDIQVSGGSNGNPLVISYTGGGGGGGGDAFPVPAYNMLYTSGGLPESYGRAISFIVPVKAGTIGFWDEGGGAIGVYVSKDGTTRQQLINQEGYVAAADGYMRVSVYDDGQAPGECLSFFSPTGGIPLYKYSYNSHVSGISSVVTGGTAFVSLIGGNGTVKIVGDGNLSVDTNADGEIVLSVSGVTASAWTPYWGNYRTYYDTYHGQTVVELYSENIPGIGGTASGYIPSYGSFSPAFPSRVYVYAKIEADNSSNYAEVHVTVNYASMKVCAVKGSGVGVGGGLIIDVPAGMSINISKTNVKTGSEIGMVIYESGLDSRFAPE